MHLLVSLLKFASGLNSSAMYRSRLGNIISVRYWTLLASLVLTGNVLFFLHYLTRNEKWSMHVNEFDGSDSVDLVNFEYIITKPKCRFENADKVMPNLIIAVNSHPYDKEMRQTIRDLWGRSDRDVQTIFFLGRVEAENLQYEIVAEDKEYGDIIQGNFPDHQHNLAYKHVMMLKWFTENCSTANYLIKMDANVFANVKAIKSFLTINKMPTDFLMGTYHDPELCPRTGTWAVTNDEYASDYFPAYAGRHSIIYSSDVAAKLFRESKLVKLFWVEDVFVTGILRSQLNIDIMSMHAYLLSDRNMDDMRKTTVNLPEPENFMFSVPEITIQDQLMLWERTEWYRLKAK